MQPTNRGAPLSVWPSCPEGDGEKPVAATHFDHPDRTPCFLQGFFSLVRALFFAPGSDADGDAASTASNASSEEPSSANADTHPDARAYPTPPDARNRHPGRSGTMAATATLQGDPHLEQ